MTAREPYRGARLGPRVRGVASRREVRPLLRGLKREVVARRVERALAGAAGGGQNVLVGPFLDEVGYELLYWIPMVRAMLERHRIPPSRVTAFSRGGAAEWYAGLADNRMEVFDLVGPEHFNAELAARRAAAGHDRPLRVGPFDRRLLSESKRDDAVVLHPIVMYTRLRHIWYGRQPLSDLAHLTRYAPLSGRGVLPAALARDLPDRYVVVKAYFSRCFPQTPANEAFVEELVARLAARIEVVVLSLNLAGDDHVAWLGSESEKVTVVHELDPATNLAAQTAVVAGAQALVATQGGFSYLGPFLGVPTLAFRANDELNPVHLEALRTSMPASSYETVRWDEDVDLDPWVDRALAGAGAPSA